MKIGEFFVELGVQGGEKAVATVKSLIKGIGELPLEAASAIAALGGIEYGLMRLTSQAIQTAIGLHSFTAETGLNAQQLQKWQGVAEQVNVSMESVQSSVQSLERNLQEIRLGRGNISPFQMLGLGVNQNAFQTLEQLRDKIKGVNPAMATNFISQMGLSPDMIKILQLSNKEFEKLSKNYHGLTQQQTETFLGAKQALTQFNLQLKDTAFEHIEVFLRALEKLWSTFAKFKTELPVILGALALVGAAFAPITFAIGALLLVLDDLAEYFTGGDSITGRAIEGLKKLVDEIKKMPANVATQLTQGLLSKTMTGALAIPGAVALPGIAGVSAMQGKPGNVFNIVIHATANAQEVAAHAVQEIKKTFGHAEMQTNNQGH